MRFCLAPEINRAKSRTGIAGEEFGDLSPAETNSPDGMGTGFVQTELNQNAILILQSVRSAVMRLPQRRRSVRVERSLEIDNDSNTIGFDFLG